jgi:hypothetical protein
MAKQFGSGKGSMKTTTDLHAGLKDRSAKFPDKSMGMKGGKSVNNDTTRSSTAKTPKTLGPREVG